MIECTQCGTTNAQDEVACWNCNAPLAGQVVGDWVPEEELGAASEWWVAAAILLLVLVVCGFVAHSARPHTRPIAPDEETYIAAPAASSAPVPPEDTEQPAPADSEASPEPSGTPEPAGAEPVAPPAHSTAELWKTAPRDPSAGLDNALGSAICVVNPQDHDVLVHTVGPTVKYFRVTGGGSGQVAVLPGDYTIRYKYSDSKQVYQGDPFTAHGPEESAAGRKVQGVQITLQRTPQGNYGTHPVEGEL